MHPHPSPAAAPHPPRSAGDEALPADLAALIGSRICHDLISPIGAIGNGVELLLMEGAAKGPELALIAESVAHANARIRFFRVAFGAAGGEQRIGRTEVLSILSDLTRGGRLAIEWQGPSDLSRADVKLAFLAILTLETAMAFGGTITVTLDGSGWTVAGQAARLRVDPALWAVLEGADARAPALGPAQVQFALMPQAAARAGRRLALTIGETDIRLRF